MTWEEPAVGTYEGRYTQPVVVKSINGRFIEYEGGGFPVPEEYVSKISIGGMYVLELHRGSTVAGVGYYEGETDHINWIFRHDDWTLWSKWKTEVEENKARFIKVVDENKDDWFKRAEQLPENLKRHLDPETLYEYMGYGYVLVILELAVMYRASGGEDTDEIMAYADREGTSGNQHAMAQAVAKHEEF